MKEVIMASNPQIQSTVQAHPQSGFENWRKLLEAQFKPKMVRRKPTMQEVIATNEHLTVYLGLLGNNDLKQIMANPLPVYINLGLNSIKFRIEVRTNAFGSTDISFRASIVRLDRDGNESQLTDEFTMRNRAVGY